MQNEQTKTNERTTIQLSSKVRKFFEKWLFEMGLLFLGVWKEFKKPIHWFGKFFNRSTKQKERIRKLVKEGLDIDILYRLQLLSSVVIATFGLLINSVPVIIGAMLIAPLLQPIQGVAYAITTGKMKMYIKSFKYIAISILIILIGSSLLSFFVPFRELTSEVLARTTPTILDLGIAFASGIIAFLVLGFKKLSGTIVGAAIAASLLPPLCATGVGLVFLNREVMRGTFLLFIANLIAIIIAGVLLFYLYGFHTYSTIGEDRRNKQILITLITLLVISIPLYTSMSRITHNWKTNKTIQTSLETTIPTIDPKIELINVNNKEEKEKYNISIQLKAPESIKITTKDKNIISQHLASQLQFPVDVMIEVIPITTIYIPKEKIPSIEEQIHTAIVGFLGENNKGIIILDFTYKETSNRKFVILEIHSKNPVDKSLLRKDIINFLNEKFQYKGVDKDTDTKSTDKKDTNTDDYYVYLKGEVEEKIYTNTGNELQQELSNQFQILFPNNISDGFQVSLDDQSNITMSVSFSTDRDPIRTKKILSKWKTLLSDKTKQKVSINANISYFEKREE